MASASIPQPTNPSRYVPLYKSCITCGKQCRVKPSHASWWKTCSPACRKGVIVSVSCVRCGKEFQRPISQSRNAKFCSRECYFPSAVADCHRCGKAFRVSPCELKWAKYCSSECRSLVLTQPCKFCGMPFASGAAKMARRTYCSFSCRSRSRKTPPPVNETHRTCRQCGEAKPIKSFGYSKKGIGGRLPRCRKCQISPEYKKALDRRYYERHKERLYQYVREYRAKNPERCAAYARTNRARRNGAPGKISTKDWKSLCEMYGNRCLACGSDGKLTMDHVIPLTRGGTHTVDNVQPLCMRCNARKFTSTTDYRPTARASD